MPNSGREADVHNDPINRAMAHFGIDTPEQRAFFLAQVSVESQDMTMLSENLDYRANRITEVYRIPPDKAHKYAHNPVALANYAYRQKNGNGDEASGDGWRFRGRGLMHITGRETYEALGFGKDPDAVSRPYGSAYAAAGFFKWKSLIDLSRNELNRPQFYALTRRINAANLAIDRRWNAYQRALVALRPKMSPR